MAPTMAWIENFLNLTNGYYMVTSSEGDQLEYLVPFPPGYISTMKAHWTTDIIVLDPVCNWQTATTTGSINDSNLYVMLHESNLHCSLSSGGYELGMFLLSSNVFMCLLDFSIKPFQHDADFMIRVRQRKYYRIQCPRGRFRTFDHRST